jgi:nucleotide-binding universal stress UspA family protein
MKTIKKILFPVDFSEVSQKIVPWAEMITKQFNAEIHLLFVARKFGHFADIYVDPGDIQHFEGEILQGAERRMDEFLRDHLMNSIQCRPKVVLGDAAEEILRYIDHEKVDLVIMGTHGRKGLEKILFGSVAERVIKMSSVPVLSVNPYRGQEHG